jgi:arginine:ornithine antiporter / lysine permease
MCAVLFAPGIIVYMKARSEHGERTFTGIESVIAIAIVVLAVLAAWLMWTGTISPF